MTNDQDGSGGPQCVPNPDEQARNLFEAYQLAADAAFMAALRLRDISRNPGSSVSDNFTVIAEAFGTLHVAQGTLLNLYAAQLEHRQGAASVVEEAPAEPVTLH